MDEPSYWTSLPADSPVDRQTLVKQVVALADKYQQMGVIIKLPGEQAYEYTTKYHSLGAGKRIPYGSATRQKEPMSHVLH